MSSFLDQLPPSTRERIKEKYKMSAAAYEKLRQKVKGPEDLEREMQWNDVLAQLQFDCETEPDFSDALKNQIQEDIKEQGVEAVLESTELSDEQKQQLEVGRFQLEIGDQVALAPEGNIAESLPVKKSLVESYLTGM